MRVARWVLVLALTAGLYIDARNLPNSLHNSSTVGQWMDGGRIPTDFRMGGLFSVTVYATKETDWYTAERLSIESDEPGALVGDACTHVYYDHSLWGWWAPVEIVHEVSDVTGNFGTSHTSDADQASIRQAAAEFMRTHGEARFRDAGAMQYWPYLMLGVEQGGYESTLIYWPGVAHNALSASAALLWLWLVGVESLATIATVKRSKRRRKGWRLHCKYDLAGANTSGGACPECGRAIDIA